MALYFVKPVSDNAKHDAFTSWLKSNLKSSGNTAVVDELMKLSSSQEELESVIRRASHLVKTHADDFQLPVDARSEDENKVFQILLQEWNAYQNSSSGMGKAVFIKQVKPNSALPVDGYTLFARPPATHQSSAIGLGEYNTELLASAYTHYQLSPLSGGIAIGAP